MSVSTQLREMLYTDSQDMHRTTTTAVQKTAPVPESMDIPSTLHLFSYEKPSTSKTFRKVFPLLCPLLTMFSTVPFADYIFYGCSLSGISFPHFLSLLSAAVNTFISGFPSGGVY
jgi:hypothetical protein